MSLKEVVDAEDEKLFASLRRGMTERHRYGPFSPDQVPQEMDTRPYQWAETVANNPQGDPDAATVVVNDDGISVTNGAITVTNAGMTVIIDGSSDMFRISASGSLGLTGCDGTAAQCTATTNVTLSTGFTYRPAHLGFMDSSDGRSRTVPRITTDGALPGAVTDQLAFNIDVTGGNQTLVTINWVAQGADRSAETRTFRYYILEQVGL